VFVRAEDAVQALAAWRAWWRTRDARLAAASALPLAALPSDPWAMLEAAGIPIAHQAVVRDRAALEAALPRLRFPLALKIQSDDIPHKTELNLLRLGIGTKQDAAAAVETLLADASRLVPAARIDGVLVQEMVRGRRELILGLRREPGLPPCVVFGLGGIFSEVMRDIAVRPAPISAFDAAEMIASLRGAALLGAVRGLGAARPGLLEDIIQRFATLVLDPAVPAEFEVNPLILADDGQSCTAVDVLAGGA
jgi:acyl-CoA synthetase (NDP forming)